MGPNGRVDALDLTQAMLDQAASKLQGLGFGDLVYNGYMFDLIPLDGFEPILKEMARVLKPGGKLVLVNMSKPSEKKTFYEALYEKGWAVMPCRPVLMSALLEPAGFASIKRTYRRSHGFPVSVLWGQEIVLAQKADSPASKKEESRW